MTKRSFLYSCGIYRITNLSNGKFYIGQSTRLSDRKYNHFRLLRIKKHHSSYLQNAYNKYGENSFKFDVLLYCDVHELDYYEQCLVDNLHPQYNLRKDVLSNRGHKTSEETKKKISLAQIGKVISEETKKKLSESHKGYRWTDSQRANFISSRKGLINKGSLGRKQPQEEKDRRGFSIKKFWETHTKVVSDETKIKSSVSHKNSPHTKRGEDNHKSVLKESDVIEIRREYNGGVSMYSLSKRFGVTISTISNVCKFKTWKHIGG